jgi:hypothetical protein
MGVGCLSSRGQAHQPAGCARTIAMIPARIAAGRLSHRSATRAKSGDFRAKSAKQDAKSRASSAEDGIAKEVMGFAHWF